MAIVLDVFNKCPPHGLFHDWLGPESVERLLRFAQSNEHRFKDSRVSFAEEERVDRTRRVSMRLGLDNLESKIKTKLNALLPVMFNRLGIKPFVPSKVEAELVAHGDGAFFERHIDAVHGGRRRVISMVYYFHALPKAFSVGVLRIHSLAASGQRGTFVDIAPDYDTLVFFPSFFPHEVLSVKCISGRFLESRFAINLWIHRS
jgi:SM-20-related protein